MSIDDIRKRLEAAEEGPYRVLDRGGMGFDVEGPDQGVRGQFERKQDAEFLADSWQDIKTLLDLIDRMKPFIDCDVCESDRPECEEILKELEGQS